MEKAPYLNLEYIYYKAYNFFVESFGYFFSGEAPAYEIVVFWAQIVSIILSAFLLYGIVLGFLKLFKVQEKHLKEFAKVIIEEQPEERATRWDKIKKLMKSESESDWRMAILEADSLVDDIIKKIGYKGETFAERLKQVKPAQLEHLSELWYNHKMRNRIAHEGTKYKLEKDEADKIIVNYEKVLTSLEYL